MSVPTCWTPTLQRHSVPSPNRQVSACALAAILTTHRTRQVCIHTPAPVAATATATASLVAAGTLPANLMTLTQNTSRAATITFAAADPKHPWPRLARACARAAGNKALTTPTIPFPATWVTASLESWAIASPSPISYPSTSQRYPTGSSPLSPPETAIVAKEIKTHSALELFAATAPIESLEYLLRRAGIHP